MRSGDPYPDFFNPILVKELRQGLRSRAYVLILLLSQLVAAFFNLLCALADQSWRSAEQSGVIGTGIFAIFVVALPLLSLNAVGGEITGDTLGLVRLSSLDGWRVLYGKWCARVAETLLLAVGLLPHFLLRFFLGGTEIGGDLSFLAVCLLASVVFTAAALACSVQRNWILRLILLAGIVAGVLFSNWLIFVMQAMGMAGGSTYLLSSLKPALLAGPGALLISLPVNLVAVLALLLWAAERLALSPVTFQPRMRLFSVAGWIIAPAAFLLDCWLNGMSANFSGPPVFFFLTLPLPMITLLVALHGFWSEPPSQAARPSGLARLWCFRPGWPGGIWFVCLLLLITYGAAVLLTVTLVPGPIPASTVNSLLFPATGIHTILMGSFVLWRLLARRVPWPPWVWLIIWLLAGVVFLAWMAMEPMRGQDLDQLSWRVISHAFFGIGFLDVMDYRGEHTAIIRALLPFWLIWSGLLTYLALRLGVLGMRPHRA